ncbi:hypothetical protein [Aggregatilinea lenta]|uniref:hypothetical protein n=1 Tax=Aggregatilinea lenta TaxID=913108 RepID=UPI0013C2A3C8|nr:hypothetical protein [Aggregatilinea lenta]
MEELGFKHLTADNWLQIDAVTKLFVRGTNGASIKGEEWLESILQPQLIDPVPHEIERLFEVARGALAYGYFFYPMYTLGLEQLYRVAESAVAYKYKHCDTSKKERTFKKRIGWLTEQGYILECDFGFWEDLRHARNSSSHPDRQSIIMPFSAIKLSARIAEKINALFKDEI